MLIVVMWYHIYGQVIKMIEVLGTTQNLTSFLLPAYKYYIT